MWVEKYRPKRLSEVCNQEEVVKVLKGFVERRNMPHLLFAGPPGTGKTTVALCLAYELFGEEGFAANYLELNASDERGIDTIRSKVKNFSRASPIGDIPFKIIHLDESDNLTADAQQALRRLMEMFSATCRFILSCNYSSRIIEPIQSRCMLLRFMPFEDKVVRERLLYIANNEGVKIDDKALEAIVSAAEGDLRKAINVLQASASISEVVTEEIVYKVLGRVSPVKVKNMIELALKGDFIAARDVLRELLWKSGFSPMDIIAQIKREILRLDSISPKVKADLIDYLGEIDYRIVIGSHEDIQLSAFIARLCSIGEKYVKS